ncbi:uncharacterized protein LOC120355693, partial [Nilaparvata lugens]|uniref:uncharacterized protein LOC120355693 n=1 Tax=Nilaparvata lugens TaxID=108931 RepID=UPI00193EADFB
MENSNKFSTEIKLVISRGQENHAVVKDEKDITFSYISKKIWKCSPRTKKGLTFWRIANRLETSMPVHMIQSYDGVEIIRKTFGKLEIFEVKYISMDGRPITVTGEMRFNERIDTAHAISQGYDAISKNEIQPRFIDRIPKRAHNSKDNYRSGTTEHYSILTINQAGTATVNFTMEHYAKLQVEELLLV